MSRHRTVFCDLCSQPISGEYVRMTVRDTARFRVGRRHVADICDVCFGLMMDAVTDEEEEVMYR